MSKNQKSEPVFDQDFFFAQAAGLASQMYLGGEIAKYYSMTPPKQTLKTTSASKDNSINKRDLVKDKYNFNSRVVCLRLQRYQERKIKSREEFNRYIEEKRLGFESIPFRDLSEIYAPDRLKKQPAPKNVQRQKQKDNTKVYKYRTEPTAYEKSDQKKWESRLKKSEEIGKQRAKERFLRNSRIKENSLNSGNYSENGKTSTGRERKKAEPVQEEKKGESLPTKFYINVPELEKVTGSIISRSSGKGNGTDFRSIKSFSSLKHSN